MVTSAIPRALRVVALVIALLTLGRHMIGGHPPDVARELLAVRAAAAAVAVLLGLACTSRRSLPELRILGLALGLDGVVAALGVLVINPPAAWEQAGIVLAMILGGAVFMPWSWRWQAAFAGVAILATTLVVTRYVPRGALGSRDAARLLFTLGAVAAASVAGAQLAERTRRQVAASEARYRGLFDQAGDAIAVLDDQGTIREANSRLAELLGLPRERIVGRPLRDFYATDPPSSTAGEHLAVLAGQLRSASRALTRADGRRLEAEITFAPTARPEGPGIQAILRDLTDRQARDRRQRLEQRVDSLARFAGGIAHQFNNLLGGILTHATVLREDVTQAAAARELDEIADAARQGRELTKELLRFTRSLPLTPRPTAPGEVVESLAALARASLPADVSVETRVPGAGGAGGAGVAGGLPRMAADPDHLIHACHQLVLNARDAMRGRHGGRLTLEAAEETVSSDDPRWPDARPGRYVRISVRDNGAGMDAAIAERAFEPFFTTKPMHEAKGLGLAEVHTVVRELGGLARIESTPGRGTVVHVMIPAVAERESAAELAPSPSPAPAPAPKAGATILIVDDEAIVRSSLRRALMRFGHRVLEAGDGPQAVAQLQSADPPVDLVILDLVLPGGGAGVFELLKALRPELKVLVSSGYSPDGDLAKVLMERVQGFLPKPYEMSELRAAVTRALSG